MRLPTPIRRESMGWLSTAPAAVATKRADSKKCYAVRAGIEATNSELKRAHGLGRLRVRGGLRVTLAANLKGLACNLCIVWEHIYEMLFVVLPSQHLITCLPNHREVILFECFLYSLQIHILNINHPVSEYRFDLLPRRAVRGTPRRRWRPAHPQALCPTRAPVPFSQLISVGVLESIIHIRHFPGSAHLPPVPCHSPLTAHTAAPTADPAALY
jgi:hypothetical protein